MRMSWPSMARTLRSTLPASVPRPIPTFTSGRSPLRRVFEVNIWLHISF